LESHNHLKQLIIRQLFLVDGLILASEFSLLGTPFIGRTAQRQRVLSMFKLELLGDV